MAQSESTGCREMIGGIVSTQKEAMEDVMRSEVLRDELLPGIVNEVTLEVIAPKLYIEDLNRLLKDHPVWRQAIRGHLVYKARVRSHATEKLFLVFVSKYDPHLCFADQVHRREGTLWLFYPGTHFLYENQWYKIGPLPSHRAGFLLHSQCESSNFAIYVMGGTKGVLHDSGGTEIYVLDLAGHRSTWRQCARMQQARLNSAVGAIHGKIFAFGGISGGSYIHGCEVYDPKVDDWSAIEPMISLGRDLKVSRVGEELFVYGFYVVADNSNDAEDQVSPLDSDNDAEDKAIDPDETNNEDVEELQACFELEDELHSYDVSYRKEQILFQMRCADFVEAYDPFKDKWRVVEIGEECFDGVILGEPLELETTGGRHAEAWYITL